MVIIDKHTNIILKPFRPEDRLRLYSSVRESIDAIERWMSWCRPDYSIQDTDEWITRVSNNWDSRCGDREFGIFHCDTDEVLGAVGINQINTTHSFANLGYWVRSDHTGLGVATSAARLAARYAFENMCLSRIEIVIRPENLPSRRVAEKVGAKFECIARNRLIYRGSPYDAVVYSLLPGEVTAQE